MRDATIRPTPSRRTTDRDTTAERNRLAAGRVSVERAAAYPAHVQRVLDEIEQLLEADRLYLETHEASLLFIDVCRVKRLALEGARHALLMYLRHDPGDTAA
jgi:hypothetical protein